MLMACSISSTADTLTINVSRQSAAILGEAILRQQPDTIVINVTDTTPDADGIDYTNVLFDFPTAYISNLADKNLRNKRFACLKPIERIRTDNYAGLLTVVVDQLRHLVPTAEIVVKGKYTQRAEHILCLQQMPQGKNAEQWKGSILLFGDSYSEQGRWTSALSGIMPNAVITNLGKSSATLCDVGNNTIRQQIERQLDALRQNPSAPDPTLILIEAGTNDMPNYDFMAAMEWQVTTLRRHYPTSVICYVTPSGLYYGHTESPLDYIAKGDKIRSAAIRLNVHTIDWDRYGHLSYVFNNCSSEVTLPATAEAETWREKLSLADGSEAHPFRYNIPTSETIDLLHPNEHGAKALARAVAAWIAHYYTKKSH